MSLIVISDLHIWGPDDPLYSSLLSLLKTRAVSGDTVVLAGDLFDLFVGNKTVFKNRYSDFFHALSDATNRGVKCFYIEGNHDFQLKRTFRELQGVNVQPTEVSFVLDGKKFYFSHGDTVVRTDYGYRFLRAFFRSPIMKAVIFLLPGKWIDKLGTLSSRKSRERKPTILLDLPLERREYLRRTFRSFAAERLALGYDFVVMGHCHDLDEMMFNIGGRTGQYVNVGFPRAHGSYLSWSPGEDKIQREKLP